MKNITHLQFHDYNFRVRSEYIYKTYQVAHDFPSEVLLSRITRCVECWLQTPRAAELYVKYETPLKYADALELIELTFLLKHGIELHTNTTSEGSIIKLNLYISPICEGCENLGIRLFTATSDDKPTGWMAVERCDTCDTYASDIEAACAYFTEVEVLTSNLSDCIIVRESSRRLRPLPSALVKCDVCNEYTDVSRAQYEGGKWRGRECRIQLSDS